MPKALRLFSFGAVVLALVVCCRPIQAQVYSYLDDNGVRVFTNIPPSGSVRDLKISGMPPAPPVSTPDESRQNLRGAAKAGPARAASADRSANRILPNTAAASGSFPTRGGSPTPAASSPLRPSQETATDYDAIIKKYAAEFDLDPKLIHSMIATESGFNSRAISPKGAQGLMQLMPETAVRLGVSNPLDPEENIWGGTRYLRFLLDTFSANPEDTLTLSLAAYNAGENLVQRLGRMPAIRETNDYVRSIIQRYGSKKMEPPRKPSTPAIGPTTFHFVDETGVLILTNIPPIDRSKNANLSTGPGLTFR
jgi:hypothetical protein